jgi:hypothetical protein
MNCWRCGAKFIPNYGTDTCLICGYEQDLDYVQEVRIKQLLHESTGYNPQTDGGDDSYRVRKKWSMRDD